MQQRRAVAAAASPGAAGRGAFTGIGVTSGARSAGCLAGQVCEGAGRALGALGAITAASHTEGANGALAASSTRHRVEHASRAQLAGGLARGRLSAGRALLARLGACRWA